MLQVCADTHFQVLLVSRPVPISVLLEKVPLPRPSRTFSPTLFYQYPDRFHSEAQAKRGEEPEVDPDQFQDPDNEYGLFAGTTYEADDEEADKIYEQVDKNMDARRRTRRSVNACCHFYRVFIDAFCREALEEAELVKHRAERPKLQQQFVDLKRGLAAVTDEEWTNIPEVGNLTRKKRKRDFERSWAVPDSVIVGNRASTEYESSLDANQQVSPIKLPPYARMC